MHSNLYVRAERSLKLQGALMQDLSQTVAGDFGSNSLTQALQLSKCAVWTASSMVVVTIEACRFQRGAKLLWPAAALRQAGVFC